MKTKIQQCVCNHEQQDKIHGKNHRVFNETEKKAGESKVYRCTVCNKEK